MDNPLGEWAVAALLALVAGYVAAHIAMAAVLG